MIVSLRNIGRQLLQMSIKPFAMAAQLDSSHDSWRNMMTLARFKTGELLLPLYHGAINLELPTYICGEERKDGNKQPISYE